MAVNSEVYTTAEGNVPDAVGHIDCTEIVRGEVDIIIRGMLR